jgi:predicted DNA-binding transcriptional regulator YafY
LLLDDEEALAIGLALTTVAASIAGNSDAALRALVKLDQLLPARLRRKWNALHQVTLSLSPGFTLVEPKVLTGLALACRDRIRVQFKYQDRLQQQTTREVEPMRLVHTGRVWYLVAWDNRREDWRIFRVDRIDSKGGIKLLNSFMPREFLEDFASYVTRSISAAPYRYQARVRLRESIESAKKRILPWMGTLMPNTERTCFLTVAADSYETLTAIIIQVGGDFDSISPSELATPIRAIAKKLQRGVRKRRAKSRER